MLPSIRSLEMKEHLVLAGAGHAHLSLLHHLDEFTASGHQVTVISPDPYHYYSGMGPGVISGMYQPEDIRFPVQEIAESHGAKFIVSRVTGIYPEKKTLETESGETLEYDLVSFNLGSLVPLSPDVYEPDIVIPVKPIQNLIRIREMILEGIRKKPMTIVVTGGGAAGTEISANIMRLVQTENAIAKIYLVCGSGLLSRFHPKLRKTARNHLISLGVEVIESCRVIQVKNRELLLENGQVLRCDLCVAAIGTAPPDIFQKASLPTGRDGGLLVNQYLQSLSDKSIFGGGDCVTYTFRTLPRIGVYAVRQNPILLHNIRAAMEGGEYREFDPQEKYMLILNMGDGKGILFRDHWVFSGKIPMWIKNRIDEKFMQTFSANQIKR